MRVFGNLNNRLMENIAPAVPEVGMGATILSFSDRHAATVVEILTPKKVVIQRDNAKRTDSNGMSESQDYEFTPDPNGAKIIITLRKNGRWLEQKGSTVVNLGRRSAYHDFSF